MNRFLTFISFTALMVIGAAQALMAQGAFTQIIDLHSGTAEPTWMSKYPRSILNGGTLLFHAYDINSLVQAQAFNSGNSTLQALTSGNNAYISHNSVGGGLAYFQGFDASGGQPWVTDGTPSGTHKLITLNTGSGQLSICIATAVNGVIYLSLSAPKSRGWESWLYVTNGTTTGTTKLKSWTTSQMTSGTGMFRALGSNCIFTQYNGYTGGIWKSNGTNKGTTQLKSFPNTGINCAVVCGGYYIFPANDGTNGKELWRTNGTSAGTVLAANINPGGASSNPDYMIVLGSKVYFSADNGQGATLFVYDPANHSCSPIGMNGASVPKWLTAMNGKLYYSAFTELAGRELWEFDPALSQSSANPRLVADIATGSGSGDPRYGETTTPNMSDLDAIFAELNGYLYFAAKSDATGYKLWRSNGTVTEEVPGFSGTNTVRPNSLTPMNGKLYFCAFDATLGSCLYVYDPNYTPPTPKSSAAPISPGELALSQNYPNPFNPTTMISFTLPHETAVTLIVSDAFGREVARLCDTEHRGAGMHSVTFDARALSSGIYYYRLEAAGIVQTRKMLLMR
ncbi:MAG: ELWxxDGT repeat protein [Bacteroidota bacterium]|jgi:ELWxxDGT repeat protein